MTRAEEAEERFSLRREMASLRKQLVSLDGSRPVSLLLIIEGNRYMSEPPSPSVRAQAR